jgi:hypothetical protein
VVNISITYSLVNDATVKIIRNVNLPVNGTGKDDFPIAPLEGYEGKTPTGHISKIRFSDGSVQSFD